MDILLIGELVGQHQTSNQQIHLEKNFGCFQTKEIKFGIEARLKTFSVSKTTAKLAHFTFIDNS